MKITASFIIASFALASSTSALPLSSLRPHELHRLAKSGHLRPSQDDTPRRRFSDLTLSAVEAAPSFVRVAAESVVSRLPGGLVNDSNGALTELDIPGVGDPLPKSAPVRARQESDTSSDTSESETMTSDSETTTAGSASATTESTSTTTETSTTTSASDTPTSDPSDLPISVPSVEPSLPDAPLPLPTGTSDDEPVIVVVEIPGATDKPLLIMPGTIVDPDAISPNEPEGLPALPTDGVTEPSSPLDQTVPFNLPTSMIPSSFPTPSGVLSLLPNSGFPSLDLASAPVAAPTVTIPFSIPESVIPTPPVMPSGVPAVPTGFGAPSAVPAVPSGLAAPSAPIPSDLPPLLASALSAGPGGLN